MNQHFQTSFPEDNEHSLNDSRDDGDHFLEEPNSEEENEMEKIELNFPKHPNKRAFHTQIESDSHFRQFYQRQPQHKAATTYQAGKPNSTSPIYNYFGEGNMYLNQKGEDKDEGNVQFNYLKKESLINSPTKSTNMEQCAPNYTDFDFFAQQQNFQGNESPVRIASHINTTTTTTNNNNNVNAQVIENLNNSGGNYNEYYENELGLSPNHVNNNNNNTNMNLDLNSFNNGKYQFNDMMNLMSQQTQFHQQQQQQQQPFNVVNENNFNNEYITEQYNAQLNPYAFGNKQINPTISGHNQLNNNNTMNLYNTNNSGNANNTNSNMNIFNNNNNNLLGQNMLNMFNSPNNINNIFNTPFMMNNQPNNEYNAQQFPKPQQQQQQPLRREDYIFEKFGKKGWQCNHCNNFNFESKFVLYTHI